MHNKTLATWGTLIRTFQGFGPGAMYRTVSMYCLNEETLYEIFTYVTTRRELALSYYRDLCN
jgi:hypothetical protein